ncbi:hypothetical protein JCM11641_008123 [Rhodosporidiobolus odoratus]
MGTPASTAAQDVNLTGSFSGIALWLTPAASNVEAELALLIQSLSSSQATPSFDPHVTLISGLPSSYPVLTLLSELATAISAWRASNPQGLHLSFSQLETHAAAGKYFQWLFAGIQPDESLLDLRKRVRESFFAEKHGQEDDYFPHLSLAYGHDDETKTAEGIIGKLVEEGKAKQLAGEGQGSWSVAGVAQFGVAEVKIVRCDGKPEEWKVLGSIPL